MGPAHRCSGRADCCGRDGPSVLDEGSAGVHRFDGSRYPGAAEGTRGGSSRDGQ